MSRQTGGCCYEAKLFGGFNFLDPQIISIKFIVAFPVRVLARIINRDAPNNNNLGHTLFPAKPF
jgi:hypothetical protein